MATLIPVAILLAGVGAIAVLFVSFWGPLSKSLAPLGAQLAGDIDVAQLKIEPHQFAIVLLCVGVAVWFVALLLVRPGPLVGVLLIGACVLPTFYLGRSYVRHKRAARIAKFQDQLEGAMRTLGGGLRVGLGIRQAMILVSEQSRDPVRYEFMRVTGLTNMGVSILDAFDQLALRMTNPETGMLARVIRVQAQTGGDLAGVLDNLAGTIRDRRRLQRRIAAITAQGRATGWMLGLLPPGVGAFIFIAEPMLRDAMLNTAVGKMSLGAALFLDALAIFTLMKISTIEA